VEVIWAFQNLTPTAVLDILLVALFFFALSFFIRGTQAVTLLRGVVLLMTALAILSNTLQLQALRWVLENLVTVLAIAIPIIFQSEIRRVLERLGQGSLLVRDQAPEAVRLRIIEDICQASERLAERRHGALIVLERSSSLQEYIRTGIPINAEVSPQILLTVFWPKTELHDGAVIIDRAGRIASASSVLPLSSARNMTAPKLGTRHRAALGLSETSDAIVVVISEETGRISIASSGRLIPKLDSKRLRTILNAFYGLDRRPTGPLWRRLSDALQTILPRRRQSQERI
jgi:diadenylate cyclase